MERGEGCCGCLELVGGEVVFTDGAPVAVVVAAPAVVLVAVAADDAAAVLANDLLDGGVTVD